MNVTIHEAKTHLSRLIRDAVDGEEIVISKGKEPMVRLTPVHERYPQRRFDGCAKVVEFMAEDFDAEIDDFDED